MSADLRSRPRHRPTRPSGSRAFARRRVPVLLAAVVLLLALTGTSLAATQVTVINAGGLTAVGPVNTEIGFPAWYQDRTGTRMEPCLDGSNPLCGFLPGTIPDETLPISFPDNFPAEFFYSLAGSTLTLPGGSPGAPAGRAVLTLGLEAAFPNGVGVSEGNQMVFARTRVVVKGGPANAMLTFRHPFGSLTIDTDSTGAGRLVQDIAPAVGNFSTPLKGNFGPFLTWDPATAPPAPAGYAGDPAQTHTVVGGLADYNLFSVTGPGLSAQTNQFTVQGKVATNTGVRGDHADINGSFLDVFATSSGTTLQVDGVSGQYATTPMTHDPDSDRHYARIALESGATPPTSVTVTNLGDNPVSHATVSLGGIQVSQASYDGTMLTVAANAVAPAGYPLTVAGIGTLPSSAPVAFPVSAPPAVVTVSSGSSSASLPVTVTGGPATTAQPIVSPAPDPGPVTDGSGNTAGGGSTTTGPVAVATVAAPSLLRGGTTTLDGSTSTGAVSFAWSQVSGTPVTLSSPTVAKPTVTVPFATVATAGSPVPAPTDTGPAVLQLVVTDTAGVPSAPAVVQIAVPQDTLAIAARARHRLGTELRIDGTSLIGGQAGVLTPPTSVVLYDVTRPAAPVRLGSAAVDTLGNWSLRLKPGPKVQVTSVLVQSTRGGTATATVATR